MGATNYTDQWADFSNYNDKVDIVAPGDDIFSAVQPGYDEFVALLSTSGGAGAYGAFMHGTAAKGASGTLVDCGIGDSVCPGEGGHICLIQRYDNSLIYSVVFKY